MKVEIELNEYQNRIHQFVVDSETGIAPSPWIKLIDDEVNLLALGFSQDENYLFASCGASRWYYDVQSGSVVEENNEEDFWVENELSIKGFGDLEEENIRVTGPFGSAAGFMNSTEDGWSLNNVQSPYFQSHIMLSSPGDRLYSKTPKAVKIFEPITSLVSYGFFPNGNVLVLAERENIIVYVRNTNEENV